VLGKTVGTLLDELMSSVKEAWPMKKITPFPRSPLQTSSAPHGAQVPSTATYWSFPLSQSSFAKRTHLMAIINATPDSLYGGVHDTIPAALALARSAIAGGASIIDIGGHSTRPGAGYVSSEEETRRVVPVVRALRAAGDETVRSALISVDTFRVEVARAAIEAGANCINDVYAFTGPDSYPLETCPQTYNHLQAMRELARETGVVVVLMHSRGGAAENKVYEYSGGVMEGVETELGEKVERIVTGKGGVRRWSVIVDPGIGFSKSMEDNIQLLRHASSLTWPGSRLSGFPVLVGPSRKSFLGAILSQPDPETSYKGRQTEAKEREWATAAAIACAVQQGVEVVRVHDVLEMGDVVRVACLLRDATQAQGVE
jgi:dihydroneopterin aldolase/2-amino-4-hydroxy-6-hydroxymethyldihydropteridine diphosphokinase/dihydropteroate synthase